jgi:regulator of sigma E protease
MLFTGSGEVSGIVGIFSTSSTILADYGFASYLYLWGLISVNLAIFNLLPFPGLDGWQLLVTAVEAITRKKVPTKVKAIISAIGLVLLFGLMIFITIKDIVHLF